MRPARSRRLGWSLSPALLIKLGLIAAGSLAIIWLCVAVGASHILRARPSAVLAVAPFDARAKARLADSMISQVAQDRATAAAAKRNPVRQADLTAVGEADRLARAALARDPTQVLAWRSLAVVGNVQQTQARTTQLFRFAERLSRRDLLTQLWLIEERVAANDVAGALRHYDIALRTSPQSGRVLLPVLVSATADARLIAPLAGLIRTNPIWRGDFLARLSEGAPSGPNAAALMERIANGKRLPPSPTMTALINRLAEDKAYRPAWRIHQLVQPVAAGEQLLRDGAFSDSDPVSIFDWQLQNDADLVASALLLEDAGDGPALEVRANQGRSGSVARQLLLASPGRYTLVASVGPIAGTTPARLMWSIACADEPSNPFAETDAQPVAENGRLGLTFVIPDGCPAQWLALNVQPGSETGEAAAWLDSVILRPGGRVS